MLLRIVYILKEGNRKQYSMKNINHRMLVVKEIFLIKISVNFSSIILKTARYFVLFFKIFIY